MALPNGQHDLIVIKSNVVAQSLHDPSCSIQSLDLADLVVAMYHPNPTPQHTPDIRELKGGKAAEITNNPVPLLLCNSSSSCPPAFGTQTATPPVNPLPLESMPAEWGVCVVFVTRQPQRPQHGEVGEFANSYSCYYCCTTITGCSTGVLRWRLQHNTEATVSETCFVEVEAELAVSLNRLVACGGHAAQRMANTPPSVAILDVAVIEGALLDKKSAWHLRCSIACCLHCLVWALSKVETAATRTAKIPWETLPSASASRHQPHRQTQPPNALTPCSSSRAPWKGSTILGNTCSPTDCSGVFTRTARSTPRPGRRASASQVVWAPPAVTPPLGPAPPQRQPRTSDLRTRQRPPDAAANVCMGTPRPGP